MYGVNRGQTISFYTYSENLKKVSPLKCHVFRTGLKLSNASDSHLDEINSLYSQLLRHSSEEDKSPPEKFRISVSGGKNLYTSSVLAIELAKKMIEVNEALLIDTGLTINQAREFTGSMHEFIKEIYPVTA